MRSDFHGTPARTVAVGEFRSLGVAPRTVKASRLLVLLLALFCWSGCATRASRLHVASLRHAKVDWYVWLDMSGTNDAPAGTVFLTVDCQRVPVFHSDDWVSQHLIPDW